MKIILLGLCLLAFGDTVVDAAVQFPVCKPALPRCKNVPAASAKPCKSIMSKQGIKIATCRPARKTNTITKTVNPTVTFTKTVPAKEVTTTARATISVRSTVTQPSATVTRTTTQAITKNVVFSVAATTTIFSTETFTSVQNELTTATQSTTTTVRYPLETCPVEPVHPAPPSGARRLARNVEDRAANIPLSCSCFLTATAATFAPATRTVTVTKAKVTVTTTITRGVVPTKTVRTTTTTTLPAVTLPRPVKTVTTTKVTTLTKTTKTVTSTSTIRSTETTTTTKVSSSTTTSSIVATETSDPCVQPIQISNRDDDYHPESQFVARSLIGEAWDQYACCRHCFGTSNCAFWSISPFDPSENKQHCNIFVATGGGGNQCVTGKCPNGKPDTTWGAGDPDNGYFNGPCW